MGTALRKTSVAVEIDKLCEPVHGQLVVQLAGDLFEDYIELGLEDRAENVVVDD